MGSKCWTWILNLLKSFGSKILDLGLDSNKVMRASKVELGFCGIYVGDLELISLILVRVCLDAEKV